MIKSELQSARLAFLPLSVLDLQIFYSFFPQMTNDIQEMMCCNVRRLTTLVAVLNQFSN